MANVFDQFDDKAPATSSNPFDQFDDAAATPKNEPGFISGVKRTVGQMAETAGITAEDVFGKNPLAESMQNWGKETQDANPAGVQSFGDIVDKPGLYIKESVANAGAQILPQAAAGIAGRVIGGVGGALIAGPAGAIAGQEIVGRAAQAFPTFIQEYGGIRKDQNDQGIDDKLQAVAAAVPATAIEFALGPQRLLGRVLEGATTEQVKQAAKGGAKEVAKFIGKEAGKSAIGEAAEEFPQTLLENWGAHKNPLSEESLHEAAFSSVMALPGGGVLGGGMTAANLVQAHGQNERDAAKEAARMLAIKKIDDDWKKGVIDTQEALRQTLEAKRERETPISEGYWEQPPADKPAPPPGGGGGGMTADEIALAGVGDLFPPATTQQPSKDKDLADLYAMAGVGDLMRQNIIVTQDTTKIQQAIDSLLGIDKKQLKGIQRTQYEKALEAAFNEPVGVKQDKATGIELPLTMGEYLIAKVQTADMGRIQTGAAPARQASINRLAQLADEEMGIGATPAIPVVGPLSAIANQAVQSGAHQAVTLQAAVQQAAEVQQADGNKPETKQGTATPQKGEKERATLAAVMAGQQVSDEDRAAALHFFRGESLAGRSIAERLGAEWSNNIPLVERITGADNAVVALSNVHQATHQEPAAEPENVNPLVAAIETPAVPEQAAPVAAEPPQDQNTIKKETPVTTEATPAAAGANQESATEDAAYRPLIEALIKNKRNAQQFGFDIQGAIDKAKEAMHGRKQMPGAFRKLADKAEKLGDKETASILRQIADMNDARKAPKKVDADQQPANKEASVVDAPAAEKAAAPSAGEPTKTAKQKPEPKAAQEKAPEQKTEAWHTPIPTQGLEIQQGDEKVDGPQKIVFRMAREAWGAITPTQRANMIPLYAYSMPSADGRHGIARLFPDDQTPPKPWVLLSGDVIRQGGMTNEQGIGKLADLLRSAPVIGEAKIEPKAAAGKEAKELRQKVATNPDEKEGADLTWAEVLDEAWNNGFETGNADFVPQKQHLEQAYQRTFTDAQVEEYTATYQRGARESDEKAAPPAGDQQPVNEDPPANPATDLDATIDDELADALGHLGDVLGEVFGGQMNITGKQYGAADLLPALSKVVELLVRKGYRSFKQSVSEAAKLMRGNKNTAAFVDQISARQWKAAYQSVAEFHEGTDAEDVVGAIGAVEVEELVGKTSPKADAAEQEAAAPDDSSPEAVAQTLDAEKIKAGYAHRALGGLGDKVTMERKWFADALVKMREAMTQFVRNDAQTAALDGAMEKFADDYKERRYRVLDVGSGVASSAVAGGSNFNSTQAGRRGNALDRAEADFNAWLEARTEAIKAELLRLRTNEEKQADADSAEEKRIKKAVSAVTADLATAVAIDKGEAPGMDRASFLAGAVRKIGTLHKSGDTEALRRVFSTIRQYNDSNKKPLFSDRHSVWKYEPKLEAAAEQGPVSTEPLPEVRQEDAEALAKIPAELREQGRAIVRMANIARQEGVPVFTMQMLVEAVAKQPEGTDVPAAFKETLEGRTKDAKDVLRLKASNEFRNAFGRSVFIKSDSQLTAAVKSGSLDLSAKPWAADFYDLFKIDPAKIEKPAAATGDEAVDAQIARFQAGVFDLPATATGTGKEGIATAKKQNDTNARNYTKAARIFLEGDMTAKVPSGDKASGLNVEFLENVRTKPIEKNVARVKDYTGQMKALLTIAAEDDIRYYLRGVHVIPEEKRMVATDGHRIVVLDNADFSGVPQMEEGKTVINRHYGEKKGPDTKNVWHDGRFPDWTRVVPPKHMKYKGEFDAKRVADQARGISKAWRYAKAKWGGYVTLDIGGQRTAVNVNFIVDMADLFRAFGYDRFTASFEDYRSPILFESPDGRVRQVVMPLRENKENPVFLPIPDNAGVAKQASVKTKDAPDVATPDAFEVRGIDLENRGAEKTMVRKAIDEARAGDDSLLVDLERINGVQKENEKPLEIGDDARIMGVEVSLVSVEEIDGVRYELFKEREANDPRGVLRRTDIDSGGVVGIRTFNEYADVEAAVAIAQSVTKPAAEKKSDAKNFRSIDALNPLTAPVEEGDWFRIGGKEWQARNGYTGRGWSLIDADKKTHPTIHNIEANSDLIREIVAADGAVETPAPTRPPEKTDEAAEDQRKRENPHVKTDIATHYETMKRLRSGEASLAEYKAAFSRLSNSEEEIKADLATKTKEAILRLGGRQFAYNYKSDKKDRIIDGLYRDMLSDFAIGRGISYVLGAKDGMRSALVKMVEGTTEETLKTFADKVAGQIAEYEKNREETKKAIADPQTVEDFRLYLRAKVSEGMTTKDARLALTPEQRIRFDTLEAEASRKASADRKESAATDVRVAAKTTEGQIIETKHTKTGEPLFVVKAAERVERDVYNQWNASAKRLGGWYSSFRGNGAVPGFQFKTRENADAFLQYLGGNTEAAKEAIAERRDSFADDRSQSAVERLNEMADRLEERADESLSYERKTNTARRARFAASAEAAASADKAMAQTMRNIAKAIEAGTAKFLDRVRQKVQVEMLQSTIVSAKYDELRQKYPSYSEQEKHRGEPATAETADYANWPVFTAYRSDLARLGRELSQIDGAKKLGQQLLKVADDITEAYQKFAKENLHKVSTFKTQDGKPAVFPTADRAEAAIARSGFKGKATTISFKRGEHLVIMGPEMAREAGLWQGDDDKRITLDAESGEALVAKHKELRGKTSLPPSFVSASESRARWKGLGIETAAEMRSALREFIGLRETAKAPDKIKELERAMIGRKNTDGLDFFPTPAETAQAMIEAAEITEGMAVLEPSAGMGHIAEQIREAGIDPDVVEFDFARRELLEAKGFNVVGRDFTELSPRGFTYGDVFRNKDGRLGVMRGSGGMGSGRVGFQPLDASGEPDARNATFENREELEGIEKRGTESGYDRIIMNPPFSNRRDAEHVQHAYSLLRPGGRIVAIMGEGVFYGRDKKAQAFRDWLDSVGGTSEKLAEGTFMDPSLPVNTATNARMVVINKPDGETAGDDTTTSQRNDEVQDGLGNIAEDFRADEAEQFAADVLAELSFEDAAFRYPVSKSKTLEGNLTAALPGVEFMGEDTRPDEREESGADHRYVFAMPQRDQRLFYVYEKGNEVWFDVSRLLPGDQGSALYHGVANYALNSGKVFVGDPHGLSEDAIVRRTAAMLSSAMRFGTTVHIDASPEQIKGVPEKGIAPLDWRGSDLDKTKALIHTFVENLRKSHPSIDNYEYDFNTLQFRSKADDQRGLRESGGRVVGREAVGGMDGGREGGKQGAPRAGSATLRRGIFLSSLLDAESGQRPGILEQVLRRAGEFVTRGGLDGVFNRRGRDNITTADKAIYGMSAEGKSAADILKFIASASRNPFNRQLAKLLLKTGIAPKITVGDAKGWKFNAGNDKTYAAAYSPKTNTVALFRPAAAERNVLHELMHAATLKALARKGLAAGQMNALFAHVKKSGALKGMYGMSDVDEFVAEAFTNPKFQEALKKVAAPQGGNKLSSAWHWFVRVVRGILGLKQGDESALSAALELGLGVMRENMGLQSNVSDIKYSYGLPAKQPINLPIDGARLKTLRGLAAGIERPKDGIFLRVTDNGDAIATGQKGQRIPDSFRRFAEDNGLTFRAERKLPTPDMATTQWFGNITRKSEPMPIAYRQDGALYFGEIGGDALDRTGRTRFNVISDVQDSLSDMIRSGKTFNWLHKSVSTQYHKATVDKDFKKVFDIGQDFLLDTSRFAMDAADQAPHLLQKLGALSDVFRKSATKEDIEAISMPIFNGTLDNRVYTDDQLRSEFSLSDNQISLYREFRAAVNKSLDDLGVSEMARIAKPFVSADVIERAKSAATLGEATGILESAVLERSNALIREGADARESGDDVTAEKKEALALSAENAAGDIPKKAGRIGQLKAQGYAPLMRFGRYTVDVVKTDPDTGEEIREFFGMYESEREANRAARLLAAEYPDAAVTQGIMDSESWKLFKGVDIASLEIFAEAVGADESAVFQDFLRLTQNNRSALKRLIKREGIKGFSTDSQRVLASFVTSNARLSAKNYHFGDMSKAVQDIPKAKGDVKEEAAKLALYLQNPEEEAAGLRGYLFVHFLGGSIASALVNMTQPITMTMPYLSQFGGASKASAAMVKAAKSYASASYDDELSKVLKLAEREGIVAPHEIHQLYAEGERGLGRNIAVRKFLRGWGSLFSLAESFNRHLTFVAAFNMARSNGEENPFEFAKKAVEETQGIYNKGNRPDWARGAIGATVFTFKQFSIAYVEFLRRLAKDNPKAFGVAMAVMFAGAGAEGWPFAEDIEDIIDTIGQFLGYNTNSKKWVRENAAKVFGEVGGEIFRKGVSGIPGSPIDISKRIGVQNLIPGTALFKVSETNKMRDIVEFAGPAGGFVDSAVKGFEAARTGDVQGAARMAAPLAVQNFLKAADMTQHGFYRDTSGRKVINTDGYDAFAKAVGFQPNTVARESSRIQEANQTIQLVRNVESEIADRWARGIFEKDPASVEKAKQELRSWNDKNPEARIAINPQQIASRVKQMSMTREQRFIKSAPREVRGEIKKEISG